MNVDPGGCLDALSASIVVVTRNRPDDLARLLESLTLQTRVPDEVLIIDNGSTVSYEPVFARFCDRLPLRCLVEPTPGIPAARNRGFQEARGDLVVFTDDDCEAMPDWLENMTRPFATNPHIGAVGGEILSVMTGDSLVEEFCASEGLMAVGRRET